MASAVLQHGLQDHTVEKIACSIPAGTTATATFLAKADGVLAGLAIADAVFAACDPAIQIEWKKEDGSLVTTKEEFGTVRGDATAILRAERVALNFMQVRSILAIAGVQAQENVVLGKSHANSTCTPC